MFSRKGQKTDDAIRAYEVLVHIKSTLLEKSKVYILSMVVCLCLLIREGKLDCYKKLKTACAKKIFNEHIHDAFTLCYYEPLHFR